MSVDQSSGSKTLNDLTNDLNDTTAADNEASNVNLDAAPGTKNYNANNAGSKSKNTKSS